MARANAQKFRAKSAKNLTISLVIIIRDRCNVPTVPKLSQLGKNVRLQRMLDALQMRRNCLIAARDGTGPLKRHLLAC